MTGMSLLPSCAIHRSRSVGRTCSTKVRVLHDVPVSGDRYDMGEDRPKSCVEGHDLSVREAIWEAEQTKARIERAKGEERTQLLNIRALDRRTACAKQAHLPGRKKAEGYLQVKAVSRELILDTGIRSVVLGHHRCEQATLEAWRASGGTSAGQSGKCRANSGYWEARSGILGHHMIEVPNKRPWNWKQFLDTVLGRLTSFGMNEGTELDMREYAQSEGLSTASLGS